MPRQEQGFEYYLSLNGEKRYRVRWEEGGKHLSRSFVRVAGEGGARAFYARVRERQVAKGRLARVSAVRLSLAEFVADVWAPKARRRVSEKTWKRDVVIYNKHILEALGGAPIAEIDAETLVVWQEELEREGRGPDMIVKAMGILSRIFKEAALRPRVTGVRGNPVALLERPKQRPRRRPRVWGPVVVEKVRYELLVNSLRFNPAKELMAMRDAALVSLMMMTGCRPQDALALGWPDIERKIVVLTKRLSDDRIIERTKNQGDRSAPLLGPLKEDLDALRRRSGDGPLERIFRKPESGQHYVETDWRNYRSRHFVPALERVEAGWAEWRDGLDDPDQVRESVHGLHRTRPYDLGRHTHSALMLASGMSLQRLARIQGHSIRVLDEVYSEQLQEFEEAETAIDPVQEIEKARVLVWRGEDPSNVGSSKPMYMPEAVPYGLAYGLDNLAAQRT
ncbi:MAG TPA: tyrosine-type recombinase/integrase [Solirubrobacterales bacterium]|nr:tyrosine-type recombinase/integrase [Solirubrobacterales bacterium]